MGTTESKEEKAMITIKPCEPYGIIYDYYSIIFVSPFFLNMYEIFGKIAEKREKYNRYTDYIKKITICSKSVRLGFILDDEYIPGKYQPDPNIIFFVFDVSEKDQLVETINKIKKCYEKDSCAKKEIIIIGKIRSFDHSLNKKQQISAGEVKNYISYHFFDRKIPYIEILREEDTGKIMDIIVKKLEMSVKKYQMGGYPKKYHAQMFVGGQNKKFEIIQYGDDNKYHVTEEMDQNVFKEKYLKYKKKYLDEKNKII